MWARSQAFPFESFGGLASSFDRPDLPVGMALRAENVEFRPGSVGTRPALRIGANIGQGVMGSPTRNLIGLLQTPINDKERAAVSGFLAFLDNATFAHYLWDSTPKLAAPDYAVVAPTHTNGAAAGARLYIGLSNGRTGKAPGYSYDQLRNCTDRFWLEQPPDVLEVATVSGGGPTPGKHLFCFTLVTIDGCETAPSPVKAITTDATTSVKWRFAAEFQPLISYRSIRIWASPIDNELDFFLIFEGLPLAFGTSYQVWSDTDEMLANAERMADERWSTTGIEMPGAVFERYHDRAVVAGVRHRFMSGQIFPAPDTANSNGLQNLSFSWGVTGYNTPAQPCPGWTQPTPGDGGSFAYVADAAGSSSSFTQQMGGCWRITGNGSGGYRGLISQPSQAMAVSIYQTRYGSSVAPSDLKWSNDIGIVVVARRSPGLVAGKLRVGIVPETGHDLSTGPRYLDVTAAQLTTEWQTFELGPDASTPFTNWLGSLQIAGMGGLTNGEYIEVMYVALCDAIRPTRGFQVWLSRPGLYREFDALTSALSVGYGDGQDVRYVYEKNGRLFIVKDRSIWATYDDGANDPLNWTIENVVNGVGTPSFRGVARGTDWDVIVGQTGAYVFSGGAVAEEANLAAEISGEWERINWLYGHTLWSMIDPIEKRLFIGVPMDGATSPNKILVMDYKEGLGAGPASGGGGRKWAVWDIAAASGAQVPWLNQAKLVFLGSNTNDGSLDYLDGDFFTDKSGGPIVAVYETAPIGAGDGSLMLHERVAVTATGSGPLLLSAVASTGSVIALPSVNLYVPSRGVASVWMHSIDERTSFRFESGTHPGNYFRLNRAAVWVKPYPYLSYRQQNP